MTKKLTVAALFICALFAAGCTKDASEDLIGSYTYKTSGTLTLLETRFVGLDDDALASILEEGTVIDTLTFALTPEQGQMHVVRRDGAQVLVTFNDITGNADVAEASVDGGEIVIAPGQTKSVQLSDGLLKLGPRTVGYGGTGRRYDDMLIIELDYEGEFEVNGTAMTVISSDVHCVAQAN